MRITSWNCLCRDVSRRLSDLAPLRSDLITLQECRRALGVPVFGGVGPPVAACATIAGRFVHLWPVREPRRTGGWKWQGEKGPFGHVKRDPLS